jgi:hypothetical protein
VKFTNLFQDPLNDSEAPYADTLVLDAGGMDVKYAGETVAHVSFDEIDPFEIAFHAMPEDWEPHEEWSDSGMFVATTEEVIENHLYKILSQLGQMRGWERS